MKVSGRYLTSNDGTPFLVHADTAWRAVVRLTLPEAEAYLDDRRARGFNTVHVHAIDLEYEGPVNPHGYAPFNPLLDLTRPVEAYWRHADAVFQAAADRGFLLAVSSHWFGWNGGGWFRHLTAEACGVYGAFLGRRYAHLPDVMWIHGGDCDPHGERRDLSRATAAGIRESAPHHLQTVHNAPERASAYWFGEDGWLDVNFAYTYDHPYKQVLAERGRDRVRPVLLGESGYEGENNLREPEGYDARRVRRGAYGALLSGAAGHAYGCAGVWNFQDDWRERLDTPGARQMALLYNLLSPRRWWALEPDLERRLVTSGGGTFGSSHYAPAASTPDGTLALVYLPDPRPVTVDVQRLVPDLTAMWFDPKSGETRSAGHGPDFTPPFEEDAVLVLEP